MIIHCAWFGEEQLPPTCMGCMDTWPGDIVLWNEDNAPDDPYLQGLLRTGQWCKASDFMRFHALYHHGGIYLDTDVEVLRPLENLGKNFLGFMDVAARINCAVMGFERGHPLLGKIMGELENRPLDEPCWVASVDLINRTIRGAGMRGYNDREVAGVRLYPQHVLYPDVLDDRSYTRHHSLNSWRRQPYAPSPQK